MLPHSTTLRTCLQPSIRLRNLARVEGFEPSTFWPKRNDIPLAYAEIEFVTPSILPRFTAQNDWSDY